MDFIAQDLREIFDAGELPRKAVFFGVEVSAVYRSPYARAEVVGGGVEGAAPVLLVLDEDLAALPDVVEDETPVTLPHLGKDFAVAGPPQPDGNGLTLLILSEA